MKTALVFFVYSIIFFQFAAAQSEKAPPQMSIQDFELIQKKGKHFVKLSLYNKGQLFSYPVVQLELNNKIIANQEGRFDSYAILQESSEAFEFPIDLTQPTGLLKFTVVIGSGMKKGVYRIEHAYEVK